MKINVIFTRHKLTTDQISAMREAEQTIDLSTVASRALINDQDAIRTIELIQRAVVDAVPSHIPTQDITVNIYGVIPAILRSHMLYTATNLDDLQHNHAILYVLVEAHNTNRSIDGQPPSFNFARWYDTGQYYRISDRIILPV